MPLTLPALPALYFALDFDIGIMSKLSQFFIIS